MRSPVLALLLAAGVEGSCSGPQCSSVTCDSKHDCKEQLLFVGSEAGTVDCTAKDACKEAHVHCVASESCYVNCNHHGACKELRPLPRGSRNLPGIDPAGEDYGVWLSADADLGRVHCREKDSCKETSIGCGSKRCELDCGYDGSCKEVSLTTTGNTREVEIRCRVKDACKEQVVQACNVQTSLLMECGHHKSCGEATVNCPHNGDCRVRCNSDESCKGLSMLCPNELSTGQVCKLECSGRDSCKEVSISGAVQVECSREANCPDSLVSGQNRRSTPECRGLTPAPTKCDSWGLQVGSVTVVNCTEVCTVSIVQSLCDRVCECLDGVSTPAPRVCQGTQCTSQQCDAKGQCASKVLFVAGDKGSVFCNAEESCKEAHVHCTSTEACTVYCNQKESCEGLRALADVDGMPAGNAAMESTGKLFGAWLSSEAEVGQVFCNAEESCKETSIGCGSKRCELDCNQKESCYKTSFAATSNTRAVNMRCQSDKACGKMELNFCSVQTSVDIVCNHKDSCSGMTVRCPDSGDCSVKCTSQEACKGLSMFCPNELSAGQVCELNCVSPDSCEDIGKTSVLAGALTVKCNDGAKCGEEVLRKPTTVTPACGDLVPTPTSPCTSWGVRVSTMVVDCMLLCTGPGPLQSLCESLCECIDTDAPTPLPTTPPPVPVPTRNVLRRVFRMFLRMALGQFLRARGRFERLLLRAVLSQLARNVDVHWMCPASACTNGCPRSSRDKRRAGCEAVLTLTPARLAEVLAEGETVVEMGVDYADGASEEQVEQALAAKVEQEKMAPTEDFQEFGMEGVSVEEVEVVASDPAPASEDDDDGLSVGVIVAVVLLCVGAVVVAVVVVCCCLCRNKSPSSGEANAPDTEAKETPDPLPAPAPETKTNSKAGNSGQGPWRP